MHEAAVTARQCIKKGAVIKYLCGTRVRLTPQQDAENVWPNAHFSLVFQDRNEATSLFLGPARFLNGSCEPNAELLSPGRAGMEVRAIQDIEIGDEITVSYGNYFGDDNYDCLCKTCEERQQNGWRQNTSPKRSPGDYLLAPSLLGQSVCKICRGHFPRGTNSECPRCMRHGTIYRLQWPRRQENQYVDPKPKVPAFHMEENVVSKSTCPTAQGRESDSGSNHNSHCDDDMDEDDYLPTLEELLRPTLHEQVKISKHALINKHSEDRP